MMRALKCYRLIYIVLAVSLVATPTGAWSMLLPLTKDLTVRLSSLNSQGHLQTVSEIVSRTDGQGKIAFNFLTVPSSSTTPFLHIQIMDGATVLRQTIVPSPQAGGNVDVGVSEVTDLHARAILKAAAISGKLTPVHLLVAQALLRTPTISTADAESIGAVIAAGVDSFNSVLASDNLTSDQLATFLSSLSKGLSDASAVYRRSVDDAMFSDQNVEAYKRGEAFAVILRTLITAANDSGINLDTIATAFGSAGATTESLIGSLASVTPTSKAAMRFGFVTGMLTLNNYKYLLEIRNSLSYVGMAPPTFSRIFNVMDLMQANTSSMQKGYDKGLLVASLLNDPNGILMQEYNMLATQDLLLMKVSLEISFYSFNSNPDAVRLMIEIASNMSNMGGVMLGMTPDKLYEILGRTSLRTPEPGMVYVLLRPFEIAAWSYISKEPTFTYTPIPGLIDQLATRPTVIPTFDRLLEPYKSIALLSFDLGLIRSIRSEEQSIAQQSNPTPLSSYYQIQNNERQRLSIVRQHISGTSSATSNALIYLLLPYITTF